MKKLNNNDIYRIAEKTQIISWLMVKCEIKSIIKICFLSEILFKSKHFLKKICSRKKKYSSLNDIFKYSTLSLSAFNEIEDDFIIINILKANNKIEVKDSNILTNDIKINFELEYLNEKLCKDLIQLNKVTDETFIDEVLKYV